MQDKTGAKQSGSPGSGKSGAAARPAESDAKQDKAEQTSSRRQEPRPRAAALTFPQPVRKEELPAGSTKVPVAKPEPRDRAAQSEPSTTGKPRPADPMALMMPFMKAGVVYSTSMVQAQIRLYDMVMQTTPLGAMARQQAEFNKMMTQAMFKMTPWGKRDDKT